MRGASISAVLVMGISSCKTASRPQSAQAGPHPLEDLLPARQARRRARRAGRRSAPHAAPRRSAVRRPEQRIRGPDGPGRRNRSRPRSRPSRGAAVFASRQAWWKRIMRAADFGAMPSSDRKRSTRCLRLQPISPASAAILTPPPAERQPATGKCDLRRRQVVGALQRRNPRADRSGAASRWSRPAARAAARPSRPSTSPMSIMRAARSTTAPPKKR